MCIRDSNDTFHTNAITSHHDGYFFSILTQNVCAHRYRVLCSKLEDVTNLECFENLKRALAAFRTALSGINRPQVGPLINGDIALKIHAPDVIVVDVCARCHVVSASECYVGDDTDFVSAITCLLFSSNSSETSGICAQELKDLFCLGG